jgi:hypothetical protein
MPSHIPIARSSDRAVFGGMRIHFRSVAQAFQQTHLACACSGLKLSHCAAPRNCGPQLPRFPSRKPWQPRLIPLSWAPAIQKTLWLHSRAPDSEGLAFYSRHQVLARTRHRSNDFASEWVRACLRARARMAPRSQHRRWLVHIQALSQ